VSKVSLYKQDHSYELIRKSNEKCFLPIREPAVYSCMINHTVSTVMIEAICNLRSAMKWCCIMSYPRI